jgi:hypothetical protein
MSSIYLAGLECLHSSSGVNPAVGGFDISGGVLFFFPYVVMLHKFPPRTPLLCVGSECWLCSGFLI